MNRYSTHQFQRSVRTDIYPMSRARDEDIVIIDKDDATTKGGGEGAVSFRRPPRHASVLEISDDECFEDDEGFLDWLDESEARISPALYSHSDLPTPRSSSIILPRNPPIATPFLSLDDFTYNGIRLHPRVFVELQDGDFMKIVHIVKDGRSSEVTIRGWIFRRTRKTNGMFNSKRNEVCWIIYIDDDDPRDHGIQSLESRLVTEVVKRRQIRLTNQPFPALSYRDDRINESDKAIESVRVLVCRYKYFIFYPNAKARTSSHPWSEKVVRRLRADECDQRPDNNIKDEDLRTDSRGDTIPGGAQEGWLPGEKEYLRQEGVSHQGINACQSLRGPFGLDYPAGDLMTRGSVGRLLTKHDLDHKSATSGTALNRTIPHRTRCRSTLNFAFSDHSSSTIAAPSMASPTRASIGSNHNNAVVIASSDSDDEVDMVNTPRRPKACNKRKRPPAFTFDEDYDVGDQETCDDPAIILDLTKSLRKSSIQPPRQRQKTSKIIKTNAEVKIKTDFIDLSKVSMDSASSRKPTTLAALQSIPRFAPKLSSRTLVSSRNFLLTPRPRSPARTFPFRRYTFGDCFCGAGGMSRGAINAGLRIAWGFDFNLAACQTFQLNFLGTPVYNVWANDFSNCKKDFKVDICHMSPPCQFFSPAHTSHGKDDDMNTASLFAIEALLKKVTPRVVTLEETAGLVRTRVHEIYFNVVINMFTSQGFSVRWKVVNCADFGVPERRMRLVIIASCPGEVLPPFPAPTHSENPGKTGLKPWTTINQAIASIPSDWPNHDVNGARKRNEEPYSGDRTTNCITTNGNGVYHPSGKRSLTHREFACIQDFGLEHKFGSIGVKKQIGNAVPPTMATVLLKEVKRALMKADGL